MHHHALKSSGHNIYGVIFLWLSFVTFCYGKTRMLNSSTQKFVSYDVLRPLFMPNNTYAMDFHIFSWNTVGRDIVETFTFNPYDKN